MVHYFYRLSMTFVLIAMLLSFLVACTGNNPVEGTGSTATEQSIEAPLSTLEASEPVSREDEFFFYTETGARGYHIFSENIIAYGSEPTEPGWEFESRFGLPYILPWESKQDEFNNWLYDWQDYQDRLSQAHYTLNVHSSLEPELDKVVTWLLIKDNVIPDISLLTVLGGISWANEDILHDFIESRCTVTYFDEAAPDTVEWRIFQGGCFVDAAHRFSKNVDYDVCGLHEFLIWKADFSGEETVIYDMKHVIEEGCGRDMQFDTAKG